MDALTKTALWLIALALWGLLLRPLFLPTSLWAEKRLDVNIEAVGGRALGFGGPIPVSQR
jgi:hypothetical protein